MRPNTPTGPVPDCDAIQDLVAEYAFGLTDAEQTRLVETNLPACPEAAIQLADFQRIQVEMRSAVPQIEPPAGLEARLMAAIATPAPTQTRVSTPPQPARVTSPAPKPLRHWYTQPMWLVAAAVLVLVVSNAIWFLRMEELARRETDLLTQLANKTEAEQAFVIANTDGLRWVRLPPSETTEANSQVVAVLMWNTESQIGLLYAQNLPKLTPNTTYQLWLTKGEARLSAGTFSIDETGKAAYLFHIKQSIDDYTWARITVEPAQGSATPSDTVVVNGKIALS